MTKPTPKGRPSKLTETQWAEIGRRVAGGESMRSLAKEFDVGVARISERFSKRVPQLKALANTLATVEGEIENLSVSEQTTVRHLADELKIIAVNVAKVARIGSDTAAKLHEKANKMVSKVVRPDGTVDQMTLMNISGLTITANKAAAPALRLATAREDPPDPSENKGTGGGVLVAPGSIAPADWDDVVRESQALLKEGKVG